MTSEPGDILIGLYAKDVLAKAGGISRTGRLDDPHITLTRTSPLCGSRIRVDLKVDGGKVADYAQEIHACALGQAAAAIVAEQVLGKTLGEMRGAARQMRAMIVNGGPPPGGEWADLGILASVHNHKARHGAVLLALEATIEGLAALTGEDGLSAEEQLTKNA